MEKQEVNRLIEQAYDSDKLAKLVVDHVTNDKGEVLARVWESSGFQDVYDYKGVERKRHRIQRKQEQVFNQIDAQRQLFQKVYYNPKLLLSDEEVLRDSYFKYSKTHDQMKQWSAICHFIAFWPLTYAISRTVRPGGVLLWSAFYYFGVYKGVCTRAIDYNFQSSLNKVAEPIAEKYGVKKPDEYIKQ